MNNKKELSDPTPTSNKSGETTKQPTLVFISRQIPRKKTGKTKQ
jgi:hypothetical protein